MHKKILQLGLGIVALLSVPLTMYYLHDDKGTAKMGFVGKSKSDFTKVEIMYDGRFREWGDKGLEIKIGDAVQINTSAIDLDGIKKVSLYGDGKEIESYSPTRKHFWSNYPSSVGISTMVSPQTPGKHEYKFVAKDVKGNETSLTEILEVTKRGIEKP